MSLNIKDDHATSNQPSANADNSSQNTAQKTMLLIHLKIQAQKTMLLIHLKIPGTKNIDNVPNIVALEVLEKNGVNIERLKELITKGVGAEFTTYYYYTILRMHCTGLDGEGIKEIVEDARIEDRNHFEAMVPRLYELGGSLPYIEILPLKQVVLMLIYQTIGKTLHLLLRYY